MGAVTRRRTRTMASTSGTFAPAAGEEPQGAVSAAAVPPLPGGEALRLGGRNCFRRITAGELRPDHRGGATVHGASPPAYAQCAVSSRVGLMCGVHQVVRSRTVVSECGRMVAARRWAPDGCSSGEICDGVAGRRCSPSADATRSGVQIAARWPGAGEPTCQAAQGELRLVPGDANALAQPVSCAGEQKSQVEGSPCVRLKSPGEVTPRRYEWGDSVAADRQRTATTDRGDGRAGYR